ncbi:MAG: SDR family oxidoreductase [Parasphingopyxis sp.]
MRLALVTGGCRRLGAAIAGSLAEQGYALALHASSDCEPDDELRGRLERAGTDWHGFAADLAEEAQLAALIPAIADRFGQPPDLLVNNAALFEEDRPETATQVAMMRHYAVNCVAPAQLARHFAETAAEGAAIVNILDQRIAQPHGDQFSYALSKVALAGQTEILARELAPQVRVNAVAPGLTIPTSAYRNDQLRDLSAAMPLDRLPLPEEIADAVAWLADARSVTGQTIFVDGGAHLKSYPRDFLYLDPSR